MLSDKKQIKSLILTTADKIGETHANALISALIAADFADIADVTDSFEELANDGLLDISADDNLCRVSETGRMILPELKGSLPAHCEQIVLAAARAYAADVSGEEYSSEIKEDGGAFYLTLRLCEKKKTVCETALRFDSRSSALLAQKNFEKRPDAVIGTIKAVVTGDIGFMM